MQPLPLALAVKLWLNNTVFADPFTLRFFTFLLDLGTELTENQCQSVCVFVCCLLSLSPGVVKYNSVIWCVVRVTLFVETVRSETGVVLIALGNAL